MSASAILTRAAPRALSRLPDRQPLRTTELVRDCAGEIICRGTEEAHVRAQMLQGFATSGLHPSARDSETIADTVRVHGQAVAPTAPEQIVGRLSLEPVATAAGWQIRNDVE